MTRIDFRPWASVVLLLAALFYVGCNTSQPPPAAKITGAPKPEAAPGPASGNTAHADHGALGKSQKLLANLGNPAAVLIVSGEQDGYMEPCGCSAEQIGGLIRRYDFVERLHDQNWPTALIELGTLIKNPAAAEGGFEQAKYKFDYAVKALKLLKYNAVALSSRRSQVGVGEALGLFDNNLGEATKIVVANVQPDAGFEKIFTTSVIVTAGPVKLGVTAVIDPEMLQKLVDPEKDVFLPVVKRPDEVLPAVLAELDAKSDYQVLMVQGPPALAKRLAEPIQGFDIVVSTSESDDPLSHEPELLNGGKTMLDLRRQEGEIRRCLSAFIRTKKTRVRYQLVTLNKRFDGPAAPMKNLIEDDYRNTLKTAGVVENFVRRDYVNGAPGRPSSGAATCK